LPKHAVTNIAEQVSNSNAISQLISSLLFDLKILSGNETENRDTNCPGFDLLSALLEMKIAVF
jgi:hypothetical protein